MATHSVGHLLCLGVGAKPQEKPKKLASRKVIHARLFLMGDGDKEATVTTRRFMMEDGNTDAAKMKQARTMEFMLLLVKKWSHENLRKRR